MYAVETLHFRYPFLPTHILANVVNDLVGTENLVTLAMQLGVDVTLGINRQVRNRQAFLSGQRQCYFSASLD
jgi:dsRNA-specific ribonuclease